MTGFVNIGGNVQQVTIKREVLEQIAELLDIAPLDREKVISIYIAASATPTPPTPPTPRTRRAPRPAPSRGPRSAATSRPRPRRK